MTDYFVVVHPSLYHGQEVAAGAEIEVENAADYAEIERMIQRGAVHRIMHASKEEAPVKQTPMTSTGREVETSTTPEAEKPPDDNKRGPGTRTPGYGRRDMHPSR